MARLADLIMLSGAMLKREKYLGEVFLAFCSMWAAISLRIAPADFHLTYSNNFFLLTRLAPDTDTWSIVAAVGAFCKMNGLVLSLLRRPWLGLPLRLCGLGISGTFWTLAGISSLLFNPLTIGGIPMLTMGITAWWTLLRFPAVPR